MIKFEIVKLIEYYNYWGQLNIVKIIWLTLKSFVQTFDNYHIYRIEQKLST